MRARTLALRYQSSSFESAQEKQQRERQHRQRVRSQYRNWLLAGVGGGAVIGALSATRTAVLGQPHSAVAFRRQDRPFSQNSGLASTSTSESGSNKKPAGKHRHGGLVRSPPPKTRSATAHAASLSLGHVVNPTPSGTYSKTTTSPVSLDELGQATWTLLHTVGAQFPEHPTRKQRRAVTQLVDSLGEVYPCHSCAKHWQSVLREFGPAKVRSGPELRTWLCEVHNVVNQSVGKKNFDCSWGKMEERWGTNNNNIDSAVAGRGRERSFRAPLCGDGGGNGDVCKIPGRK